MICRFLWEYVQITEQWDCRGTGRKTRRPPGYFEESESEQGEHNGRIEDGKHQVLHDGISEG
jgi:hypothetical protein